LVRALLRHSEGTPKEPRSRRGEILRLKAQDDEERKRPQGDNNVFIVWVWVLVFGISLEQLGQLE